MTRSITYGVLLIILTGLVVTAYGECPTPPAGAFVTDLLAGQTLDVGDVTIWNDDDYLYVLYQVTEDGWYLTETHLDVQCDVGDIPQTTPGKKSGPNPIPGHFEYGDCFEPSLYITEWCQVIEKPDCADCGEELAVAAHAVVVHVSEGCVDIYSDGSTKIVDSYSPINDPLVNGGKNFAVYPFDAVPAWEHPNWAGTKAQFAGTSADWIWESEYVQHPVAGDIVYFEKTFDIPGIYLVDSSGTMKITCDNGYEFFVNGASQGSAQVSGDWRTSNLRESYVSTDNWQTPEDFDDFADNLMLGSNTFRFETANEEMSQASGEHGSDGTTTSNPGALIFAGEICYSVVDREETAWGEGTRFNTQGNWGMWTGYDWVCPADLELTKTITTEPPYAVGDVITWVVEVKNQGPGTAFDVVVKDYPPDVTLVTIDDFVYSAGTFDPTTYEWDVGDLASGDSETLTMTTTINDRGAIINSAEVFECATPDPDSTPGNYDPQDHAGTDEDDSDVASIIFFPVAGNAYIGYEDRTAGDFDYNDFGMNMELTEVYKNNCLDSIDMTFTSVVKKAGDVHDIHITRLLDSGTTYDYTITRSVPATGTETPAGPGSGSGYFGIILFDSAYFSAGKEVSVHIDITGGCEAFVIPAAPRCDLDPVFTFYCPWMKDRSIGTPNERHILDVQPATGELGSTGYNVPYILVVPSFNWPAPDEGNTINSAAEAESGDWYYEFFDECYSSNCANHPEWYNEGAQKP